MSTCGTGNGRSAITAVEVIAAWCAGAARTIILQLLRKRNSFDATASPPLSSAHPLRAVMRDFCGRDRVDHSTQRRRRAEREIADANQPHKAACGML